MKAVLQNNPGNRETLFIGDAQKPSVKDNEVLVRVKATALNRMDIIQREGRYPLPDDASSILGVDMAGVVEDFGSSVTNWKKGDEVFGLLQGGGYAEYTSIAEGLLWRKPSHLSFEEAAALPEVFMTAYQTLFWLGELQKGQSVLIHAGASGVGTAAIQLCKEMGITSFVTAGSEEKIKACCELGAKAGFNYKEGEFAAKLREANSGKGVNAILDFVGAPYWEQNISLLEKEGVLVIIGFMGGPKVPHMNLAPILRNWIKIKGTTLRARSEPYRIELAKELGDVLLPALAEGRIKPVIHQVLDLEQVQEAHQIMEENQNTGKIVLRV